MSTHYAEAQLWTFISEFSLSSSISDYHLWSHSDRNEADEGQEGRLSNRFDEEMATGNQGLEEIATGNQQLSWQEEGDMASNGRPKRLIKRPSTYLD